MKERHKQIRDYIVQYTISHGWPPSVREIGEGVGLEQCTIASQADGRRGDH